MWLKRKIQRITESVYHVAGQLKIYEINKLRLQYNDTELKY